jgi:subtilase family serine protease
MAQVATDAAGVPLVVKNPVNAVTPAAGADGSTWAYSPQSFHTAYRLPWYSPVRQTIAVIDVFGHPNAKADLDVFNAAWGLGSFPSCSSTITTACFQRVNENGGAPNLPLNRPPADGSWNIETNLDVQAAHGMCLNCRILLVEAANTRAALETANNTAARLGATQISNSWTQPESSLTTWNPSAFVHPGVAVTASTGDHGFEANYPADLNTVIAVGGTTLTTNADGTYAGESVWGNGINAPTGAGAGSACSTFSSSSTAAPTWQKAVPNWVYTGCGAKRAIADVAADADPATGAWVYNSVPNEWGQAGWFRMGGTSLSAPLIAGVFALAGNTSSYSWPAQMMYQRTSQLHDVTAGTNGSCTSYIMCHAWTGYDGPTGVGTPQGLGAF